MRSSPKIPSGIASRSPISNLHYASYSQFAVASRDGDPGNMPSVLSCAIQSAVGEVLSPFGPVEGLTALLRQTELPEHPLIQAQERHISGA